MFKKLNKLGSALILIFIFALILLFSVIAEATLIATIGDKNSSGDYRVEVSTDGTNATFKFQTDTAILFPYQSGTTNDTLIAADSGRTYVITSATVNPVVISLPTAAVGMVFKFVSSSSSHAVYVRPDGTDIINYASLAAGSAIYNSSAAKGDSITLFCVTANEWDVDPSVGTWASGGGIGD